MTVVNHLPQLLELRELAGPPEWVRGEARVADGWVELTTRENYAPCAPHVGDELLFALPLAGTARGAATFARRFGLLRAGPDAACHREPLRDWKLAAGSLGRALALYARMVAAADGDDTALGPLRELLGEYRLGLDADWRAFLDRYRPVDQAAILLAELVSAGLREAPQRLLASPLIENTSGDRLDELDGPPRFVFGPDVRSLVGLAWHMLGLHVAHQVPVRVCAGCSAVFAPSRGDQRYHEPACGARQRQRRARRA